MQGLEVPSHPVTQNARQGERLGRDHRNGKSPLAEAPGQLEADESRADQGDALLLRCGREKGARVIGSTQEMAALAVASGDPEHARNPARGKKRLVE